MDSVDNGIDALEAASTDAYDGLVLDVRPGDQVSFAILRDGVEKTVSITVTKDCLTAY